MRLRQWPGLCGQDKVVEGKLMDVPIAHLPANRSWFRVLLPGKGPFS